MRNEVKYFANFQHMAARDARPRDEGDTMPVAFTEQQFGLLPSVGDYVSIQNAETGASFSGKVQSRLFSYIQPQGNSDAHCLINIVVADTDDDWGLLIKE
ncbi:hypothetical protein SAMN02745194_02270 [Roseomonas rosea]|uniref:Uncharacterized protein n=1 Tax=Muricoccus roseus TaxID=198092 RepID=A0A1M6I941_9PROT|nr:hypothetical protein [Roseomonas rosea]SHJ30932.1 hypothetical protein SAMN02745194_02270 [Roseomonas rosea]